MQILFLQEQADEQAVEPAVQVPVKEAQVVANDVIAEVHELDRLPLALALALALQPAEKDLARRQLELLQAVQELRVQQGLCLRIGHGSLTIPLNSSSLLRFTVKKWASPENRA